MLNLPQGSFQITRKNHWRKKTIISEEFRKWGGVREAEEAVENLRESQGLNIGTAFHFEVWKNDVRTKGALENFTTVFFRTFER